MSPPWPLCALLALLLFLLLARAQESEPIDESSYTPCECDGICECVYIDRCGLDNYIITTGEGRLESRLGIPKNTVKKCTAAVEKCCHVPEDELSTTPGTNTTVPPEDTTTTKGGIDLPLANTMGGCGVRRERPDSLRILSDAPISFFGEFPWMVALFTNGQDFVCGGSLIGHSVVLTAAHCVHKYEAGQLSVRAGDWDLAGPVEALLHQKQPVIMVEPHPKFNPDTFTNDLALLLLKKPFQDAVHLDVVCLPDQGASFTGQNCVTTGWGMSKTEDAILKRVDVPILDHSQCQQLLRRTRQLGRFFRLDPSFVCAGGQNGNDACLGDGGGPLVCRSLKDEERYYQAGVVSAGVKGINCGRKDVPTLYTNLGLYTDWISKELKRFNVTNEAIHP